MNIRTVTGATIRLGKYGGLWLDYVLPCGNDWIAEIKLVDVGRRKTPSREQVFVSQNPGVATRINLAHQRGDLAIQSGTMHTSSDTYV